MGQWIQPRALRSVELYYQRRLISRTHKVAICLERELPNMAVVEIGAWLFSPNVLMISTYSPDRLDANPYWVAVAGCSLANYPSIEKVRLNLLTVSPAYDLNGEMQLIPYHALAFEFSRANLLLILELDNPDDYLYEQYLQGAIQAICYVCNPIAPPQKYRIIPMLEYDAKKAITLYHEANPD